MNLALVRPIAALTAPRPRLSAVLVAVCVGGAGLGCSRAPLPVEAPRAEQAHAPASATRSAAHLACDPSLAPAPAALRRLSVREYANTLSDLLGDDPALRRVPELLSPELDKLPRDGETDQGFSNMDARTSERHLDTYVSIAERIAREVVSGRDRLAALAGECALSPVLDRECLRRFVADLGQKLFRRPLAGSEVAHFADLSDASESAPQVYERVTAQLFAAPEFLFHVERSSDGETPGAPDVSGYELAARLSFHFWETTPDATLSQAAASGALATPGGYRAAVERLVSEQRARATWYRFFREWLGLEDFAGFAQDPAFSAFSGNVEASAELYRDAVWEIEELVGYYTFDTRGTYRDLLTSDAVLTRSTRLARLYEVEPWDGRSEPQHFDPQQRSGLLTRAATLISSNHTTNPFRRGAFVRRRLLCEPIEPPSNLPPGALSLPPFDAAAPTRLRYERKVAAPACQGCHDLFSPFGYALERYDGLGRYRQKERLIDDQGGTLGHVPIDAHVQALIDPGPPEELTGPVALSQALADSKTATECLVRQYFRFTFRRMETAADACTLNAMLDALAQGGLFGLFRGVAFTADFTRGSALAPPIPVPDRASRTARARLSQEVTP